MVRLAWKTIHGCCGGFGPQAIGPLSYNKQRRRSAAAERAAASTQAWQALPKGTLCTHADQGLPPTVWQQDVCPWSLSSGQPAIPETGSFPPVVLPCRAGWLPTAALSTCQMAEAHLTYCEWISCHYTYVQAFL